MALFRYTARDINAKKITGKQEAANRKELTALLRQKNEYLIECKDVSERERKVYRMKLNELSDYSRQLGSMLASGVSLIRAMAILVQREQKPLIKMIYTDIYRKLQQGVTLSQAMQDQKGSFPVLMINMYRSGESTGQMDKVAMTMALQYEKDFKLNNKLKSASIYPIILICMTLFVMIIAFTWIVPQFSSMFGDMELPMITKFMLGMSHAMTEYWYWIIVAILSVIAFISTLLRKPDIRNRFDRWKLKCPKIGKMLIIIYSARFARTLCSLYTSGISIINSLNIVKTVIGNKYIEEQFAEAIMSVRNGTALSMSIQKIDGFDKKLSSSIYIGEESGRLETMLTSLADDFDYEAEIATQKMVTILEPIMIVFIAIIILFVMIAVLLPIFKMYQDPTFGK